MILDTLILVCCALGAAAGGVISWALSLADRAKRAESRRSAAETEYERRIACLRDEVRGWRCIAESHRKKMVEAQSAARIWERVAGKDGARCDRLLGVLTDDDDGGMVTSMRDEVERGNA